MFKGGKELSERKVVITAALTGGLPIGSLSRYVPITPQQIADEAIRSYNAGAAIAHIHIRNPETGQPMISENREEYLSLFHEVLARIKSECDMVCCLSTGGRATDRIEDRICVVPALKPELATCSCGSVTFRPFRKASMRAEDYKHGWEQEVISSADHDIFENSMAMIKSLCAACKQAGTKPELELYDVGMIDNVLYLVEQGYLDSPVYLQFIMGFPGGIPSTPRNLSFMHETALGTLGDFAWSVAGTGRRQMGMCTQAILLGSNCVRVGLEDSLVLPDGSLAKSSAEQVDKVVRIANELGIEPATPDEARQILGLKGIDNVNW